MPSGEYSWIVWIVGLVVAGVVFAIAIIYGRGLKVRRNSKGGLEVELKQPDQPLPEERAKVSVLDDASLKDVHAEVTGVQSATPESKSDVEVLRKAKITGGALKAVGVQVGSEQSKEQK